MPDATPDHPLALRAASIKVPRTARYYRLGAEPAAAREVWIVCHGYGQLARYFLRPFRSVVGGAHPERLMVAPEGLSRFYLDHHTGAYDRVAASWMTRDARLDEIGDQVTYLDAVLAETVDGAGDVRLGVLGFSQGAATAARWLDRSPLLAERGLFPSRFVVWGADLPHDLDLASAGPRWLSRSSLHLVIGSDDEYATPERIKQARVRLDEAGVPYRYVPYEGGHRVVQEAMPSVFHPLDSA
jgi:predicted esterase